jgi:hypothetical protein
MLRNLPDTFSLVYARSNTLLKYFPNSRFIEDSWQISKIVSWVIRNLNFPFGGKFSPVISFKNPCLFVF